MKLRVMSYNTQSGFAIGRKVHDFRPQAIDFISGFPQKKFICHDIFAGSDRTVADLEF